MSGHRFYMPDGGYKPKSLPQMYQDFLCMKVKDVNVRAESNEKQAAG